MVQVLVFLFHVSVVKTFFSFYTSVQILIQVQVLKRGICAVQIPALAVQDLRTFEGSLLVTIANLGTCKSGKQVNRAQQS